MKPTSHLPAMNLPEAWVFTWDWCKRVAWFWLPGGVLFGLSYATWHATSMHAWHQFPALAWRSVASGIVIVSAGRLLACLARRRARSSRDEPWLVAAAILAGFVIAYVAAFYITAYHAQLMRGPGAMAAPPVVRELHQILVGVLGNLPTWIMLLLACGGYDLFAYMSERRRQREIELSRLRAEKSEADLRLSVLQAQIEPHFLFNTLASVRALVMTEPARAAATIDALADYLRSTLPQMRDESYVAPLGPQIEICRNYLELMKIRMGGRLTFTIAVSPQAATAPFPPLLLLPLVENAVTHGIEPKPGAGHILVKADIRDGKLTVAVEDDGQGLQAQSGSGVGLANVREQLRRRFGDAAELSVTGWAQGVRAQIEIPAPTA